MPRVRCQAHGSRNSRTRNTPVFFSSWPTILFQLDFRVLITRRDLTRRSLGSLPFHPVSPFYCGSFPRRYIPEPCLKGPRECPTPMAPARLMAMALPIAMVLHTLGTSGKRRTLPELSSAQHPTVRLQVHPYIRPNLLHTICHSRGYRCSVFPMYGRIDQSREHKEQHQVGTRGPHHDHVLIYHAIHRV